MEKKVQPKSEKLKSKKNLFLGQSLKNSLVIL